MEHLVEYIKGVSNFGLFRGNAEPMYAREIGGKVCVCVGVCVL